MLKSHNKTIIFLSFIILMGWVLFLKLFKKPPQYNIILITLDALRADHLGCYGYKRATFPFLDKFSRDAFIFTNTITQSASTQPSVASMLTSKYPYSDCVVNAHNGLESLGNKYITLGGFLKTAGYKTLAITGTFPTSKKLGFERGFDYFYENYYDRGYITADEITESAIAKLKIIDRCRKFFLWLHFFEPHAPYARSAKYREYFSEPFSSLNEKKLYRAYDQEVSLSDEGIHRLTIAYDANIRFADDNLEKLFEYLKKEGLINKSIIIITADHGESLGEHNIFGHNELYYGIMRVPLFIKIPNSKGRVISYPVSLLDIFPTILKLLGYKDDIVKLNLRGKDLFLNRGQEVFQFSEYPGRYSIIQNNWRIFLNAKGNYEFYNIKDDPLELNNLVSIEKEKFEFLKKKLDDFIRNKEPCIEKPSVILGEEDKEKLRSLGYVQ